MLKSFLFSIFLIFLFSCITKLPQNIKLILKKRCNSCHSYKIYKKIKTHDKRKWEEILHKMVIKGARLDEDEFNQLLNYFSESNR